MNTVNRKFNPFTALETQICWMGQAGYLMQSKSGEQLGIDLYLSDCVEPIEGHDGYHRLMPKLVNPAEINANVLIATHFHRDHFDLEAMPLLMSNNRTVLYCAWDCENDVKNLGLDESRVIYVKPGEHYEHGAFLLDFVNCDHGTGAPLAVGVIVTVDGKRILEVGDTCLHIERSSEYLSQGPLDVLIAPINGAYGNLNECECVKLVKTIQPKLTIPSHFGMFASHGGNPGKFIDLMRGENAPYKILTLGESFTVA